MAGPGRRHERWMRGLSLLILVVVAVLLARYARAVDWPAVGHALAAYRPGRLITAAALGALSYLLYCGYDVAARAYTGHGLSTRRVIAIAFVSYAFNLNLGALVGGGGLRYRLYTRYGIRGGTIVRIIAFSIVTNWSGYLLLAGGVFVFGLLLLPEGFAVGSTSPRILGALMLATLVGYLLLCAFGHHRTWKLRGTAFAPPSLPLAGVQLALSSANWLAIAAILFILLEQRVDYPSLLGVVLLGAVAAAMTHIPAGLGALEAVFVILLGNRIAQADLLAALLAYRALYYLVPLLVAVVVYVAFESRGRRRG
jgi:glycosyltransferase 2 family protein